MADREKDAETKDSEKYPETDHGDEKVSVPELKMEAVPNPDSSSASSARVSLPPAQLTGRKLHTKEDVLAYPVNWDVYDKNAHLREKMKVYISQRTAEFLRKPLGNGPFVNIIVDCIRGHNNAASLLDDLKCMFKSLEDEEKVEIFFLNIWRRLIINIQEVELQAVRLF